MRQPVFRATLPLPPSVNDWLVPIMICLPPGPAAEKLVRARMAVRTPSGIYAARVVKSQEAKRWLEGARKLLAGMPRPSSLHQGVLELRMRVYVSSLASDGGNRLKLPEDAFKSLVIDDDRQFVVWSITKDIDPERPRVELEVRHADPAEHPRVAERLARAEKAARKKTLQAAATEPLVGQPRPPVAVGARIVQPPPLTVHEVKQRIRARATPASYHRPGGST